MKRHLHLNLPPDTAQRRLLARVETDYAVWLHHQSREQEAKEGVRRAVRLTQKETVPQEFWGEMFNLATWYGQDAKRGPLAKARGMEERVRCLPPGFVRTQQVCDMALFLGPAGQHSSAWACLEEAERGMNRPQDLTAAETYYFALTRERVRLAAGETLEIPASLLAQCPNPLQRLHINVLWTKALLKEGETVAALRYLTRAQRMLTPEIPTRMHRLVKEYGERI